MCRTNGSATWVMRDIASGQHPVAARISAGSERRAIARARCEFGNAFGADGVNGATQFLDTAAERLRLIYSDAVVF